MNINRKYIIIFGTLVLLLVIIVGGITYYKEKAEQAQTPDLKQDVLSFSQDYPDSLSELKGFIRFCHDAVFSDIEELKNKEMGCLIVDASIIDKFIESSSSPYTFSNPFIPISLFLESFTSFKTDQYLGISVDLKDVVREYDSSLLEKDKLYFCSISEPSWTDPFYLQIEPKQDLIFDEGDISCAGVKMNNSSFINFSGFVPQAESLNIKQYLVDEQTVAEVINKQSFSEIKEILKDYPIIWQMEKPIIP